MPSAPGNTRPHFLSALALVIGAAGLATAPAFAQLEGFYIGVSASAEEMDVETFKTVDNTPAGNMTLSQGKIFTERDSDTQTASGVGLLAGYSFPLGGAMFLSAELDVSFHSGKARGNLEGTEDPDARAAYDAQYDPDLPPFSVGPQAGENWPERWTFEKDYSYGLTLRLGGQPDALARTFGPDAAIYALAGIHRIEAEYTNAGTGCFKIPDSSDPASYCNHEDDFEPGFVRTDRHYTAWSLGLGLHKEVADRTGLQVEAYYRDYDSEPLVQLDGTEDLGVRAVHVLEAEEIGLKARLLRYF